jgi:LysR family transcriptional regulator, cys regulon transcriptional activator
VTLQQLRYVCEVARQGLNISEAALSLHTSQPGISKQIRLLEGELGVEIYIRSGKRIVGITPAGQAVLAAAERMVREAANLHSLGKEFRSPDEGILTIATTHTQARYVLPPVIRSFSERYPAVKLSLHQGNPIQVAEAVATGTADLAIATEAVASNPDLLALPCYQWNRCVVVPPGHPLLLQQPLSLQALAQHPLVTYDFSFTGRAKINQAFEALGLTANVVLTALDSDVIKTYVELGLGVGILASMAFDPARDVNLRAIDASHLFEPSVTRVAVRRGNYLRAFHYHFITLFAPQLTQSAVEQALLGGAPDYVI